MGDPWKKLFFDLADAARPEPVKDYNENHDPQNGQFTNGQGSDIIQVKEQQKSEKSTGEGGEGRVKVNINGHGEAVIPREKLTEYALDPTKSPDKAKAFEMALGYTKENADDLIENIKANINKYESTPKGDKGYGERFQVVMVLTGPNGKTAPVLTAWIKDKQKGETRLTSLYVKERKKREE